MHSFIRINDPNKARSPTPLFAMVGYRGTSFRSQTLVTQSLATISSLTGTSSTISDFDCAACTDPSIKG
jgi:hypothetical protein